MTCTLSLGPDNTLSLRTPSGRELRVPVSPHATDMLWQILWQSSQQAVAERRLGRHSYKTAFPAQHVVDAWARDIMPQRREEEAAEVFAKKAEEVRDKYGFDLGEIDL